MATDKLNTIKTLLETELHKPVDTQKKKDLTHHIDKMSKLGLPHSKEIHDCKQFLAETPRPTLLHMMSVCYILNKRELGLIDYYASDEPLNINSLMQELEDLEKK